MRSGIYTLIKKILLINSFYHFIFPHIIFNSRTILLIGDMYFSYEYKFYTEIFGPSNDSQASMDDNLFYNFELEESY